MQRAATVVMNKLPNVVPLDENWGALVEIDKNRDRLPRAVSDAAFAQSGTTLIDVEEVLAQASIADPSELEPIVDRILMDRSNVAVKESYRAGKHGTLGFFVGQVMKETKGKADPKLVSELLRRKLDAPA
jgi:Asp-tRNA(Asn)/Glu-tRNA(Gln) amidotransferase B subunit